MLHQKKKILFAFALLCLLSLFSLQRLNVNFQFEQFFPEGDPDLAFFKAFTKDFEKDDNFLLISLNNEGREIFDTSFMQRVHQFTLACRDISYVYKSQSLTTAKYPLKTPFGYNLLPLIHLHDATKLQGDKNNIQADERFNRSFISADALSTIVMLKTADDISVTKSDTIMEALNNLVVKHNFEGQKNHILGRAAFQSSLVAMQKKEVIVSTIISAILVSIIIYLIFASWITVAITMLSIGASLLIFMGLLSITGRELSVMAALYPIIILIVGAADVMHLLTKYIDTIDNNKERNIAVMTQVIREIGFATFLTCITTAIGFFTLATSRLYILREFGINAGFGVLIAFLVIVVMLPCMLISFSKDQLYSPRGKADWLQKIALHGYTSSKKYPRQIMFLMAGILLLSVYGMSLITTNYKILSNLPTHAKVTEDFLYFEKHFSGFRPLEFAITVKPPYKANDFEIVKEIDKIENKIKSTGIINSVFSQATMYKSIEMMNHGNQKAFYKLPDSLSTFLQYSAMIARMKGIETAVLINKSNNKTRISSIISDIGADSIKKIGIELDQWIAQHTDQSKIAVRRTGTGLILDKNSEYITSNLLNGLWLSVLIISLLMAYLVKSMKMLVVAFVPNVIPLLFGAAIIGFFNIELEASVSIIFSVIYGIAVDDTIHFLSRYKICIEQGMEVEEAIEATFVDTGKAVVLTSVILFFGFLVMLFSNHPPSVIVGVLTSFTLMSALLCDLYFMPIMIRYFYKKV